MLAIIEERSRYSAPTLLSGCGPAHGVERLPARRRIALADDLLVAVGLLLHRLDRHRAALPVVAVEQAIVGAGPDVLELVGQVEGVLDAAVHAHAAERVVDVGGIAGQQDAAVAEILSPPADARDRASDVRFRTAPAAARRAAARLAAISSDSSLLAIGVLRRRHQHAPQARHPQQHQPLERVGDVVDVGDVGQRLLEREVGRGDQEQLRIGEALELHAERAAHRAARAVRRDHIAAGDRRPVPTRVSAVTVDAIAVLPHRRDLMTKADVGYPAACAAPPRESASASIARIARDTGWLVSPASSDEIEGRDRPGLAVAELPGRRLEPDLDHARHDVELVQQVERRRMERRAAQLHHQLRLGGEQHDRECRGGPAPAPRSARPDRRPRQRRDHSHSTCGMLRLSRLDPCTKPRTLASDMHADGRDRSGHDERRSRLAAQVRRARTLDQHDRAARFRDDAAARRHQPLQPHFHAQRPGGEQRDLHGRHRR